MIRLSCGQASGESSDSLLSLLQLSLQLFDLCGQLLVGNAPNCGSRKLPPHEVLDLRHTMNVDQEDQGS